MIYYYLLSCLVSFALVFRCRNTLAKLRGTLLAWALIACIPVLGTIVIATYLFISKWGTDIGKWMASPLKPPEP